MAVSPTLETFFSSVSPPNKVPTRRAAKMPNIKGKNSPFCSDA